MEITNQTRTEETKHKVIILLISKRITKIILQDHKSIEPRFMCLSEIIVPYKPHRRAAQRLMLF